MPEYMLWQKQARASAVLCVFLDRGTQVSVSEWRSQTCNSGSWDSDDELYVVLTCLIKYIPA